MHFLLVLFFKIFPFLQSTSLNDCLQEAWAVPLACCFHHLQYPVSCLGILHFSLGYFVPSFKDGVWDEGGAMQLLYHRSHGNIPRCRPVQELSWGMSEVNMLQRRPCSVTLHWTPWSCLSVDRSFSAAVRLWVWLRQMDAGQVCRDSKLQSICYCRQSGRAGGHQRAYVLLLPLVP